jgi:hypothetical protein
MGKPFVMTPGDTRDAMTNVHTQMAISTTPLTLSTQAAKCTQAAATTTTTAATVAAIVTANSSKQQQQYSADVTAKIREAARALTHL